jgi:uncharacterized protein (TIGR02391 family)
MKIPIIGGGDLEAISKALGDTAEGLTGSEINALLLQANICNPEPLSTKWKRLFTAFLNQQKIDKCGNKIIDFIQKAMSPGRYINEPEKFKTIKQNLNHALSLAGYKLENDGRIGKVQRATTLFEAKKRAKRLKSGLEDRNVHPMILRFCYEELVQENYFHAVFEATKSIAARIRDETGLDTDGAKLIDKAFKIDEPFIMINKFTTETEKSEQKGFVNFIKGILGMFRNTTAHTPKIKWEIPEEDALEILSAISLVHRKLDKSTLCKKI